MDLAFGRSAVSANAGKQAVEFVSTAVHVPDRIDPRAGGHCEPRRHGPPGPKRFQFLKHKVSLHIRCGRLLNHFVDEMGIAGGR